ncbi:tyrosine-type recombinase/integrase [Comamonas sp. JUb58]|uniref:tyrosine-type recombinase/integrase n=1 Tax=Comamonas sp. JUb58 TaxID=2485114 RepID=UPI00105C25DE|nr:tyrosine-type recombinase/integrase [Comamonas sp. JUb58]TDS70817.1 site-specific recombinase XerD [Comamonas sp. JUb58]
MLALPIYLRGGSYYLHTRVGGRQFKKSLGTGYKKLAILRAIQLLNSVAVMTQKPTLKDFPQVLTAQGKEYKLNVERGVIEADTPEEHQRAMEALKALKELKAMSSSPQMTPIEQKEDDLLGLTLNELVDNYFKIKSHLTLSTKLLYQRAVDDFSKFLKKKNITINRIQESEVVLFQNHLADKKLHPRTIDSKIKYLAILFNFAIKQNYYRFKNPFSNKKILTAKENLKNGWEFFEKEEITSFYKSESFKNKKKELPDYYYCLVLALATGLRASEITAVKKDDFKKINDINYLKLTDSKTSAGIREIPIHSYFYEELEQYINSKKSKVFTITSNNLSRYFTRHLEKIGVKRKKLVLHSIRKFVNNELMMNGVNEEYRCQFIGHEITSINTATYTKKYLWKN